jgi:predicted PurR-regulated permease PerM
MVDPIDNSNANGFEDKIFKAAKLFTAIALLVGIVIVAADVFLLIFAGILLAIFLTSLAGWLARVSPLSYGWSVASVCLVLTAVIALGCWRMTPSIAEQFDQLTKQIPRSLEKIKSQVQRYSWAETILKEADPKKVMADRGDVVSRATGFVSGFLGGLASFVIILFIGIYGAAEPELYKRGVIHLIPQSRRQRLNSVLEEIGETLRWWLIGKLISMAIIGVLTTLGLWLMDVPLALILGTIAAIFTFVPNIGPVLSAIPAVLLGLIESPSQALYIGLLYIGIQTIESYVITPLIQRKTISLPPGLTLATQVLMGVLFGAMGVALATPLTAVALVATKRLYVEDTLGDHLPEPC